MKRFLIIALLLCASPAWAVTATIGDNTSNTYAGAEDTQLYEDTTTTNYGATDPIESSKFATSNYRHTLIKFSGLSNITGSIAVTSATLYLWAAAPTGEPTLTFTAKRLLRNWVEGSGGVGSDATWTEYSTGNSWTTGGATSDGNDRSSTVSATATVATGDIGSYIGFTSAQLIADVQDMIDSPGGNFGWHIERTDGADDSNFTQWTSSEGTDTHRPYLDITYTVSTIRRPITVINFE